MSDYWLNDHGHKEEMMRVVRLKSGYNVKFRRSAITGPFPTQMQVVGMFKGLEDYPFARLCIQNDTLSVTWWVQERYENE